MPGVKSAKVRILIKDRITKELLAAERSGNPWLTAEQLGLRLGKPGKQTSVVLSKFKNEFISEFADGQGRPLKWRLKK